MILLRIWIFITLAHWCAILIACVSEYRVKHAFRVTKSIWYFLSAAVPAAVLSLFMAVVFVWQASPVVQGNSESESGMRGWVFLVRYGPLFAAASLLSFLIHLPVVLYRCAKLSPSVARLLSALSAQAKPEGVGHDLNLQDAMNSNDEQDNMMTVVLTIGLVSSFLAVWACGAMAPSA